MMRNQEGEWLARQDALAIGNRRSGNEITYVDDLAKVENWIGSCTAPGFSDTRQRYAASCVAMVAAIQFRRVSAGLR